MENVPRCAPWVAKVGWERSGVVRQSRTGFVEGAVDASLRLQKEVEAFAEYVSPTKAEDEVRGLIEPDHQSCGEELCRREGFAVQEFRDETLRAFGVSSPSSLSSGVRINLNVPVI